jgi:hypothetical protein
MVMVFNTTYCTIECIKHECIKPKIWQLKKNQLTCFNTEGITKDEFSINYTCFDTEGITYDGFSIKYTCFDTEGITYEVWVELNSKLVLCFKYEKLNKSLNTEANLKWGEIEY